MQRLQPTIRLALALISIIGSLSLHAQTAKGKTETKEMYFRIVSTRKVSNDSIIATINGGKKYGVQLGSIGQVKANNKYKDERSLLELGFASVLQVNDTTSIISIKPMDKTGNKTGYDIRKGDYTILKIKVPALSYHSVLFEFALLDCQFNNMYSNPLYAFEYLLYSDSKQVEDSIKNAAAADVRATYEALKDMDSTYDMLRVPLTEGRYKGRSIFDVMAKCTERDITAFFNFAINYSGSYMGNTFKVNETFATWVMNKALYSRKEVYDSIRLYMNRPLLLKAFVDKNLENIKKENFVNNWISDANDAAEAGKLKEAAELFEAAKILLAYLQNDCLTAYYYYNYPAMYQKDYARVLKCYDSSYMYFSKCDNPYFMVQTLVMKGMTYNSWDRTDEAIKAFDQMHVEMNRLTSKLKPNQINSFTAKYNHFSGILQYAKGELKKAAIHYENAVRCYKAMGDYSSLQSAITVQGRLAKLYKKQGELQKSLDIYNERLVLYTKLNDRKNIAETLTDIGDIQFDLANYDKCISLYKDAQSIHLSFSDYDNIGLDESMIASSYYSLGKYDSSIRAYSRAIDYRRLSNNKAGMAFSWKILAKSYNKSGEKTKALIAYDSAAYYYTAVKDSSRLRDLLSNIGDVYYDDKQYRKAFSIYLNWHQLNIASNNKADITNSLYSLGMTALEFDTDSAFNYLQGCYRYAREIGDRSNEMYAGLGLGQVSFKKNDITVGESYFSGALQVAVQQKNKKQEANCYKLIGVANATKLDFDKAVAYYKKAIAIYDSIGERTSIPTVYNSIASTLQQKGQFGEARAWHEKAIVAGRQVNSLSAVGYAYSGISFSYVLQGSLDEAQRAADSCKYIFKELNNNWQIADSYVTLGNVSNYRNDYDGAVHYYMSADSLFRMEKDDWGQSSCQNNIGNVYFYQADYEKSLKYFFESERILGRIKVVSEAHVLAKTNIGEVYYNKKDYVKAEKYLQEGYKLAKEKNIGRLLTSANVLLGMLYFDTKKYPESEKYLLEGQKLAQQMNLNENTIAAGLYLGKLYAVQNRQAQSMQQFAGTILYSKNHPNSKYSWETLYEYGLLLYSRQQLDSAASYFKQAVQLVENAGQKLFGGAEAKKIYSADEKKVDLYNKLVASLAKLGNKEEALYYADKSNNQAIKEQMEKTGIATSDKEKDNAIKKGGELLQKQNAVEQAIAKEKAKPEKEQNKELISSLESIQKVAQKDYINYINGLVKKYPDMQAYFSKTNPADFKNNMRFIPDSTLAVLYIINDKQLFIFTATKQEIGIKVIELKTDINKQAERFWAVLRNPANVTGTGAIRLQRSTIKSTDGIKGDFKTEASILYDLLITPITDQLKGKKNICIIPNSKLSNVPFQAIGNSGSDGQFHFLVEDYAIFYTNKMDIFSKPFEQVDITSSFIALGNPDKSLPNATVEVNNFSKVIKNATILTENAATEDKATNGLSNYKYVHFATHGILDYSEFEKSYLVFAPDKDSNGDGKLTIEKINGLTISNCNLVTLSACETAVSKESVKGWYISPANSFLQNNVSSVVASLWKVDDEATSVLMLEFYKQLVASSSKIEALRKAQETLSKDSRYSHPYFWAAFVLYGEWR